MWRKRLIQATVSNSSPPSRKITDASTVVVQQLLEEYVLNEQVVKMI